MDIQKYLTNFNKGDKKLSLYTVECLLRQIGNPQEKLKIIHVAGTNGKGSFCEMMSNVLLSCGYKVGKFIGPHLIKYNERISINNINIKDNELEEIILKLQPYIEKYNNEHDTKVTFFELTTIIAFIYFFNNKCDFVILEVGLGGIYDATNVCRPLISVITSIGYDHTELLGKTLEEIAVNKAGIIKENSKTVFCDEYSSVTDIIKNTCNKKSNLLYIVNQKDIKNYTYDNEYQRFDYKNYKNVCINLKGRKQIVNASMCLECVNILKKENYNIYDDDVKKGLSTVVHRARFELINSNPTVVFDGAHNISAIENFKMSVDMYYKNSKKVFIISILKTKDYEAIIKKLVYDSKDLFIFTSGNDTSKYAKSTVLYDIALKYSNSAKLICADLEDAIKLAFNNYKDSTIFVLGSFYIYGSAISIIEKYKK